MMFMNTILFEISLGQTSLHLSTLQSNKMEDLPLNICTANKQAWEPPCQSVYTAGICSGGC